MQVTTEDSGRRLDRWLESHFPSVPFGTRQKLLRTGQVRVDGKRAKGETRLDAGQEIRLPPSLLNTEPTQQHHGELTTAQRDLLDSAVLYSDAHLVVLNKPSGLAVQGGSGITHSLDAWLKVWGGDEDGRTLRLTHRLDRDTSGVLLLARGAKIAAHLTKLFQEHAIEKTYLAVVEGIPKGRTGKINAPLRKAMLEEGERMIVDPVSGLPAITHWKRLSAVGANATWMELKPEHGRTHQLRVHMAHIGHPIVGDGKYGNGGAKLHLHAASLRFQHPVSGHWQTYHAPLPDHMPQLT